MNIMLPAQSMTQITPNVSVLTADMAAMVVQRMALTGALNGATGTTRTPNHYQPSAFVVLPHPHITRPDCALLPTPSYVGWCGVLMLLMHIALLYPLYGIEPPKVPAPTVAVPVEVIVQAAALPQAPAPTPIMPTPIAPKQPPVLIKSKPTPAPKKPTVIEKSTPKPTKPVVAAKSSATIPRNTVKQTSAPVATPSPPPALSPATTSVPVPTAPVIAPLRAAIFDADYLHNPKPAYPKSAARRGIEGTVVLSVVVSVEGRAHDINIAQSSGDDDLDDAARAAVQQWRFVPAKQGDIPVASTVRVPIRFSLQDA